MQAKFYLTSAILDMFEPNSIHVFEIYRVTAKRGWFGYLREYRMMVARVPNDYSDKARDTAKAMLAKFKAEDMA